MTSLDALMWVAHNMPDECALALERFTRTNPRWRGANWEDVLDVLLDSDSHLELTESLWEDAAELATNEEKEMLPLICPIGVTLLYACGEPPTLADVVDVLEQWAAARLGTTPLEPSLGTHDE